MWGGGYGAQPVDWAAMARQWAAAKHSDGGADGTAPPGTADAEPPPPGFEPPPPGLQEPPPPGLEPPKPSATSQLASTGSTADDMQIEDDAVPPGTETKSNGNVEQVEQPADETDQCPPPPVPPGGIPPPPMPPFMSWPGGPAQWGMPPMPSSDWPQGAPSSQFPAQPMSSMPDFTKPPPGYFSANPPSAIHAMQQRVNTGYVPGYRPRGPAGYEESAHSGPGSIGSQEDSSGLPSAGVTDSRKRIPTWLRDGIEQMEKEKARKEERERISRLEQRLRAEREASQREQEDGDDDDGDGRGAGMNLGRTRRSRFDQVGPEGADSDVREVRTVRRSAPIPEIKSEDIVSKMKEMMTMTLLETTECMMREVAQEVLHKARRRRKRADNKARSMLPPLNLGLGHYVAGDSSEEEPDEPPAAPDSPLTGSGESDAELERQIRGKRERFERDQQRREESGYISALPQGSSSRRERSDSHSRSRSDYRRRDRVHDHHRRRSRSRSRSPPHHPPPAPPPPSSGRDRDREPPARRARDRDEIEASESKSKKHKHKDKHKSEKKKKKKKEKKVSRSRSR